MKHAYIYSARLYAEITTSDNGLGAGFPMKTDSVSPHSSLSRQSPFIHKINLTNVLMFFLKKKLKTLQMYTRTNVFFFCHFVYETNILIHMRESAIQNMENFMIFRGKLFLHDVSQSDG